MCHKSQLYVNFMPNFTTNANKRGTADTVCRYIFLDRKQISLSVYAHFH